jgi:hypothetical protein
MIAFVVPGVGGRDVTRAMKDMSFLMRGQGRVPFRPMPRRVGLSLGSGRVRGVDATRIGVVATIRVRGRECGSEWFVGGGILVGLVFSRSPGVCVWIVERGRVDRWWIVEAGTCRRVLSRVVCDSLSPPGRVFLCGFGSSLLFHGLHS